MTVGRMHVSGRIVVADRHEGSQDVLELAGLCMPDHDPLAINLGPHAKEVEPLSSYTSIPRASVEEGSHGPPATHARRVHATGRTVLAIASNNGPVAPRPSRRCH